jgi:hypothetical protein
MAPLDHKAIREKGCTFILLRLCSEIHGLCMQGRFRKQTCLVVKQLDKQQRAIHSRHPEFENFMVVQLLAPWQPSLQSKLKAKFLKTALRPVNAKTELTIQK